jgi:hypothetical protein
MLKTALEEEINFGGTDLRKDVKNRQLCCKTARRVPGKLAICLAIDSERVWARDGAGVTEPRIWHVRSGSHGGGSEEAPFETIGEAAAVALPGDRVLVHAGVYREWVSPPRGGTGDTCRITYEAASGERAVIKGSEPVSGWEAREDGVWTCELPDSMFGDFNPFREELGGDWFLDQGRRHLAGDVYLNGRSLFEAASLVEVGNPIPRPQAMGQDWVDCCWYAEPEKDRIRLYARFGACDPNEEQVEVTVRPCCFYPRETGINYITVRGFEMCHAACGWAPPTAEQVGLLGPHWAKGWIIEDNHIYEARCTGISLGKDRESGHNEWTREGLKHGTQCERDVIFAALNNGWSRKRIGSHIVRRNVIHDCEQAGICGHLGAVFSRITDNHIYRINAKAVYSGYEIAGIKLHAAIDTEIVRNRLHDCRRGLWLDWQTQGTRVSANLMYGNVWEDLYVEVSHGPYVVANNLLLSPLAIKDWSQGGAYLHNLVAGAVQQRTIANRFTPYHVPHSTKVMGLMTILGGDTRYLHNLFVAGLHGGGEAAESVDEGNETGNNAGNGNGFGTAAYDGYPPSGEEPWREARTVDDFAQVRLPVLIQRNVYGHGTRPYERESEPFRLHGSPLTVALQEDGDAVRLVVDVPSPVASVALPRVHGADLGYAFQTGAPFENPDGSPLAIDRDYHGRVRGETSAIGPFAEWLTGRGDIAVWPLKLEGEEYV